MAFYKVPNINHGLERQAQPKWSFRRVVVLVGALFVLNVFCFAAISHHWQSLASFPERIPMEHLDTWLSPGWALLESTQMAVKAAGGMPGSSMSVSARQKWKSDHPCDSRDELPILWAREKKGAAKSGDRKSSIDASNKLETVFQEYAILHRTCTNGGNMTYVTELYQAYGNLSTPCKFLVVDFGSYGIGNRMLWLVSGYLYALLTQRVLLIDTRSTTHTLLCEPFPGSSWQLPQEFPYSSDQRWLMPADFYDLWDAWEEGRGTTNGAHEALLGLDGDEDEDEDEGGDRLNSTTERKTGGRREIAQMAGGAKVRGEMRKNRGRSLVREREKPPSKESGGSPPFVYDAQANDGWSPNPRFFCEHDQQRLHQVKWLSLSGGCLYFLPDLFAVPSFKPALEELFPNRDPLTHLLRHIMFPAQSVWERVKDLYDKDFRTAKRVVGIQVRYRDGGAMYNVLNKMVNTRITRCATERGIIPSPVRSNTSEWHDVRAPPVVIYIASLYPGLHNHLRKVYSRETDRGGGAVKLVQLSHAGFQAFDLDGDFQAFSEMVSLSLSDEIMTSPMSTFGYMAQAYGNLTPWLIEFGPESSVDCVLGKSTDACYQVAISKFACPSPSDKDLDGRAMQDVVPYLQPCQDTEGLQLIPPFR